MNKLKVHFIVGLNSILFVNIYNTQHIHVLQIQVIYKRDPEESRMTYLNLYPQFIDLL